MTVWTAEAINELLEVHDYVDITFTVVDGSVTTRVATSRKRPESDSPLGKATKSESIYRFFNVGKPNRFDPTSTGDWSSAKLANILDVRPSNYVETRVST